MAGPTDLLRATLGEGFRGVIPAERAPEVAEALGCSVAELAQRLVPFARAYSIGPVSGFEVGAVAQATSGSLYLGANLELPGTALAFTVHAEQSTTTNAWLNGEEGLTAIAVSAPPCGHCRQVLNELTTAATLSVQVAGQEPVLLSDLLPAAFGPDDLHVPPGLMSPQDHCIALETADPLVRSALSAANASYAPYTKGFAGVALETASGVVYEGRYAENAAFNPSMSALASALTMRVLGGGADDALTRAVLVEAPSAVSQAGATAEALRVVAPVELELYGAA